jgi:hypothetical protein
MKRIADHYYSLFVDRFPLHPAGEIPHLDAYETRV